MAPAGKEWIKTDETAKQMLSRIFIERPFIALPPPLHKLPLRAGNVVEILGPSSSAKTHVLMQATISCILPKEWKGVEYGGMERMAAFVDLDCRFDVLRFSHLLKNRIVHSTTKDERHDIECDEELFAACMRRFLYVRCYDIFEFIATLKTMTNQFKKEKERQNDGVLMLVFDSIGAFYWMGRAWSSSSLGSNSRKSISLQSVTEVVVQEIQKLLLVNPMLVLASKTVSIRDKSSRHEVMRNMEIKPPINVLDMKDSVTPSRALPHYDYMPSVWQSFVSHRIQVHPSEDEHSSQPIYMTEWLLPSIKSSVKFAINDVRMESRYSVELWLLSTPILVVVSLHIFKLINDHQLYIHQLVTEVGKSHAEEVLREFCTLPPIRTEGNITRFLLGQHGHCQWKSGSMMQFTA